MLDDAALRLEKLRTVLTEAMVSADELDALAALHLTAALNALNQRALQIDEQQMRRAA